jgi:hypothetical protein
MFCFTSSRANKWRRPCLPGSLPSLVLYQPKLYDLDFGEVGVLELPATGQVLLPSYWFIDVLQRTEKRPGEASFLLYARHGRYLGSERLLWAMTRRTTS